MSGIRQKQVEAFRDEYERQCTGGCSKPEWYCDGYLDALAAVLDMAPPPRPQRKKRKR
jgi:hypothetical protein